MDEPHIAYRYYNHGLCGWYWSGSPEPRTLYGTEDEARHEAFKLLVPQLIHENKELLTDVKRQTELVSALDAMLTLYRDGDLSGGAEKAERLSKARQALSPNTTSGGTEE